MKRCVQCGKGELVAVNDIMSELDSYVFISSGTRCNTCGEEYLGEEEVNRMASVARKLGVWGEPMKLHRKLSKSARGTMLRIPSDIEKSMKLKGDENVQVSRIGTNKILIEID